MLMAGERLERLVGERGERGERSGAAELDQAERVITAAKRCCERWGRAKTTVDDIAAEAGISRATLYRLFPGGRDKLFEAMRQRETEDFFVTLSQSLAGATSFEDLLVRAVVNATRALREDEHLRLMLATEPGEVVHELTVHGLPVILRVATDFLTPWFDPYIDQVRAAELAELLSRLVISYFLAPSTHYDLADPDSAASFLAQYIVPAFRGQPVGR
jgi:AcrR family transcriptional regulator